MKKSILGISVLLLLLMLVACSKSKIDYLSGIELPSETIGDIDLPSNSVVDENISLLWLSDTPKWITPTGVVTRDNVDQTVKMTVYALTDSQVRESKEFTIKVLGFGTKKLDNSAFESVYGFAYSGISNRQNVKSDNKAIVNNEIEFLDALKDKKITVIEIKNDLNMGSNHVKKLLMEKGVSEEELNSSDSTKNVYMGGSFYRANQNTPIQHPTLIKEGVGQIIIQNRDELMIYSNTGAKISHLTTQIKDSSNIVFRNLHLTGIWEWDDDVSANYDLNDWDYFTIERTNYVWLDHMTLDQSYDGLVDVKGFTSNFTLSYFKLDFVVNDFINDQIDALEEKYQKNIEEIKKDTLTSHLTEQEIKEKLAITSRYAKQRLAMSTEQVAEVAAFQKKGFNFGNTTQGLGFETITITMHNFFIRNLQDRIPRLRSGDVHMYNMYVDASDIVKMKSLVTATGDKLVNQAIVPTEEGSVLMENSKFVNVMEPIKTHQDSNLLKEFTGRYEIKNSVLYNGFDYYKGSSSEVGTEWRHVNTNISWTLEFLFRNHQFIPYQYENQLIDSELLHNTLLDNYVGAGEVPNLSWLNIRSIPSQLKDPKSYHLLKEESAVIDDVLMDLNQPEKVIGSSTGNILNFPTYPVINNFYGGIILDRDVDYTVTVDDSLLDKNKPGNYQVTYKFQSLVNDWDSFERVQTVVVYDSREANEIYYHHITDEFDGEIEVIFKSYSNQGTLYYLFSEDSSLSTSDVINQGMSQALTSVQTSFVGADNLKTKRLPYLYLVIDKDGIIGQLIMHNIRQERVVEVKTKEDFSKLLLDGISSINKYYVLMNDIDFAGYELPELSSAHRFMGVLDGQGYTLKNISMTRARGGIFFTIEKGYIKNLVIDQATIKVDQREVALDPELPNVKTIVKPSDDAGILATYIYVWGKIENITIKNSSLDTVKNYAGALLGRVRTGEAFISNISLLNVSLRQRTTDAKYMGGFLGGGEANTKMYLSNLYANNLKLEQFDTLQDKEIGTDMIGGILGRIRSYTEINYVVIEGLSIKGRHNIGLIAGKEEATLNKAVISNVYVNATLHTLPDMGGMYSDYIGYIYGNPDANKSEFHNINATTIDDDNVSMSKGQSTGVQIKSREAFDTAFFETLVSLPSQADVWEVVDGLARLKNSTR